MLDNFSTGRLQNLDHLKENPRLAVHGVDIGSGADLSGLFDGVERAFHLAALADIVTSIETPHTYHRANVEGTFQVLQAAKEAGVKRFVYYGLPDVSPTPEDADIRPMYPYALTKHIGETCVMHWAPKGSFEDGVNEMIDNIDYWCEAPLWDPQSIADATSGWFRYLKE